MSAKSTYTRFARFYDAYVGQYALDVPFYLELAARQKLPVIEAGCGTGRILSALLRQGHSLTGVDISKEMLELAAEKLLKNHPAWQYTLLQHNFVHAPLPQKFGLALVTFYTFNYLRPHEQQPFLQHLSECLEKNGRIALHLFYPSCMADQQIAGKWVDKGFFHIDGEEVHLQDRRMMLDDFTEERVQIFGYPSGQSERIQTLRYYISPTRLSALLDAAGFSSPMASTKADLVNFRPIDELAGSEADIFVYANKR